MSISEMEFDSFGVDDGRERKLKTCPNPLCEAGECKDIDADTDGSNKYVRYPCPYCFPSGYPKP